MGLVWFELQRTSLFEGKAQARENLGEMESSRQGMRCHSSRVTERCGSLLPKARWKPTTHPCRAGCLCLPSATLGLPITSLSH